MASEKGDAFSDLFKGFKEAHPELKAQDVQKKTTLFWNSIKRREDYKEVLKAKMVELKKVANRKKSGLMAFWAKVCIRPNYYFILKKNISIKCNVGICQYLSIF